MLNKQQEINFRADERIDLELTDKGRQWLYDDAALRNAAEAGARAYLKWLDSLIKGEQVDLRREAKGDFHLIPACVYANTSTKVVIAITDDTLLPGGVRYEQGEKVVISKNIDILIAGARRLARVGGE